MIKKNKLKDFTSCNGCGRYNIQPSIDDRLRFNECGEITEYTLGNRTNICIRLCQQCQNEMKKLFESEETNEDTKTTI